MVKSRILVPLFAFVTAGMAIAGLLQLAFVWRMDDTIEVGTHVLRRRVHESPRDGFLNLSKGFSLWEDDEEARVLRIGLVKQDVIRWSPRIILLHNFLSPEECDYLIAISRPRLAKSTVVDTGTGKGVESKVRTSTGTFLSSEERKYSMIQAIEKRISIFSMIPVENGELLQVLRYEPNQYYKPHHDYFSDEFNVKRGGQRVATMLIYLSDVADGGETYFPGIVDEQCTCGGELMQGLCVKPKKGNAILFWSQRLDGSVDPMSIHGSCKVLRGEKWSATKWLRQRKFG